MKKKKYCSIFLLVLLLIMNIGCGNNDIVETNPKNEQTDYEEKSIEDNDSGSLGQGEGLGEETLHIEKTVVDKVVHNQYDLASLSDEQEEFLDTIIAQSESGNLEEVGEMISENILFEIFSDNSYYLGSNTVNARFLYNSYKVYGESHPGYRELILISVEEKNGYLYGYSEYQGNVFNEIIRYGTCECKDGMFNGDFQINFKKEYCDSEYIGLNSEQCYYKGTVENGLITGDYEISGAEMKKEADGSYIPVIENAKFASGKHEFIGYIEYGGQEYYIITQSEDGEYWIGNLKNDYGENPWWYLSSSGAKAVSESSAESKDGNYVIYPY